jgi:hypothetical protein
MAQDEMPKFPKAALSSARGGEGASQDQEPDTDTDPDDTDPAADPATATFARLHKILAASLSPEDLETATQLIQQLFVDTDQSGGGSGMAGDSRQTRGYSKRFPDADRLGKKGLTGVTGSSRMAFDGGGSTAAYLKRFPNAGRLVRTV